MSTRSQVRVKPAANLYKDQEFRAYHHCDGYPSNMVQLLFNAFRSWSFGKVGRSHLLPKGKRININPAHMAVKALNYIVSADRDGYEIETKDVLHGDLEFAYSVIVRSEQWIVTVWRKNWDHDESIPDSKEYSRHSRYTWTHNIRQKDLEIVT